MLRGHPQHKLQVEGVQLRQEELRQQQMKGILALAEVMYHSWFPLLIILLTIKMMPNTASQRRTVEAGFHSNFTQLYGVNWNAIRFIFPLGATQQR